MSKIVKRVKELLFPPKEEPTPGIPIPSDWIKPKAPTEGEPPPIIQIEGLPQISKPKSLISRLPHFDESREPVFTMLRRITAFLLLIAFVFSTLAAIYIRSWMSLFITFPTAAILFDYLVVTRTGKRGWKSKWYLLDDIEKEEIELEDYK